jgi:hypothetical protein
VSRPRASHYSRSTAGEWTPAARCPNSVCLHTLFKIHLSGHLHYVPYHDSSCSQAFTERQYEDALIGYLARITYEDAIADGEYCCSVSDYREVYEGHCTFNLPFQVTSSCVNMLSCSFSGEHVYISGRTSFSPSNICSRGSSYGSSGSSYGSSGSSYGSSGSSYHSGSSSSPSGVKAFFYAFFVLPCCLLRCLWRSCKNDDPPPAQTTVVVTSVSALTPA